MGEGTLRGWGILHVQKDQGLILIDGMLAHQFNLLFEVPKKVKESTYSVRVTHYLTENVKSIPCMLQPSPICSLWVPFIQNRQGYFHAGVLCSWSKYSVKNQIGADVSQWMEMTEKFVKIHNFLRRDPIFSLHFIWYMIQLLFKMRSCSV